MKLTIKVFKISHQFWRILLKYAKFSHVAQTRMLQKINPIFFLFGEFQHPIVTNQQFVSLNSKNKKIFTQFFETFKAIYFFKSNYFYLFTAS